MTYFVHSLQRAAAAVVAVVLFSLPLCAEPHAASELRAEYERLSERFAEAVSTWRPACPMTGSLVFVAPDQYTEVGRQDEQLRDVRDAYADALFELATQAAEAGELSLAFQWATEAVRENPDHGAARRVLGYERRDGRWLTPYGVRMHDAGKSWHPRFGWIEPADRLRYEAGERPLGSRWISDEDDAARRRDMRRGWQVRTDHFLVTTNHSLEAAVELAARLERLHQVWRQLFAGFYLTEREVQRLFAGERSPRRQVRPFRVFYHRDRDEYAAALVRRQPRIAETLGIYFDRDREAHFFAGDDVATSVSPGGESTGEPPVATLYHEAVHQLFQESRPAARHVGELANFWIVEGVANYFETLREHGDAGAGLYYTIGEASAGRLPAARERLLDEGFYLPLAELARLGKSDLQQHPEIAKLYSQSTGLTAFLMDADDGRFREPLVRYLEAVYAGRDDPETLSHATGLSYPQLDAAYRRYTESLP